MFNPFKKRTPVRAILTSSTVIVCPSCKFRITKKIEFCQTCGYDLRLQVKKITLEADDRGYSSQPQINEARVTL